jgi:hypothetical protein
VEQGGTLIADGEPAVFDEHSRKLSSSQLSDLFAGPHDKPISERSYGQGKAIFVNLSILNYYRDRLLSKEQNALGTVGKVLKTAGVAPAFSVTESTGGPAVGVEVHTFRNGGVDIVGLLANRQLYVEDLGQADTISNRRFDKAKTVLLNLPAESFVYDVRAGKSLGRKNQLTVQLDPYDPTVFAISPSSLPTFSVSVPARLTKDQIGQVGMNFAGATPAATHIFHVDVTDPAGKVVPYYSGNVLAAKGRADKFLPLSLSDKTGNWTVHVKDLLTGQVQTKTFEFSE